MSTLVGRPNCYGCRHKISSYCGLYEIIIIAMTDPSILQPLPIADLAGEHPLRTSPREGEGVTTMGTGVGGSKLIRTSPLNINILKL